MKKKPLDKALVAMLEKLICKAEKKAPAIKRKLSTIANNLAHKLDP